MIEITYYTMGDVAEMLGKRRNDAGRRFALRWLEGAEGALIRIGKRWYTTAERLLRAFPDLRAGVERAAENYFHDGTRQDKTGHDIRNAS